jgi:hypothetical protein
MSEETFTQRKGTNSRSAAFLINSPRSCRINPAFVRQSIGINNDKTCHFPAHLSLLPDPGPHLSIQAYQSIDPGSNHSHQYFQSTATKHLVISAPKISWCTFVYREIHAGLMLASCVGEKSTNIEKYL